MVQERKLIRSNFASERAAKECGPASDGTSASLLQVPNILSASRIMAAAVLVWAVVFEVEAQALALAIVALAALSDCLDGAVARATGMVSDHGARLDPIADKTFVLIALGLLWGEGVIDGEAKWAALLILWREVFVAGLRDHARFGGQSASVSSIARLKTAAQFLALLFLFASRIPDLKTTVSLKVGLVLLWVSACLALYSGGDYLLRARRRSWT